uniref:Golgin subfamily A conserved domain-containing protein n=1 Tax=Callithrix jacchus TaxID=9483 RepID=A0A8I3XDJ2_CALJA
RGALPTYKTFWVPFLNAAKASAQEEQARLCEQLQKQQVCCQHQAQLGASALKEPEAAAAATGTGSESGCGETQRALQGVINKLQVSESWKGPRRVRVGKGAGRHQDVTPLFWLQRDFMDIVKENLDLKEWVEKLELGFIQLSGERDMISEQEARQGRGSCRVVGGAPVSEPVLPQESPSNDLRVRGQHQTPSTRRRRTLPKRRREQG